jgi:hypothetical protein
VDNQSQLVDRLAQLEQRVYVSIIVTRIIIRAIAETCSLDKIWAMATPNTKRGLAKAVARSSMDVTLPEGCLLNMFEC